MKSLIVFILFLIVSAFAVEVDIAEFQYQRDLEKFISQFLEKHIKPDDYILSVKVDFIKEEAKKGEAEKQKKKVKRKKIISDDIVYLPFQSEGRLKEEILARKEEIKAKKPEAPTTKVKVASLRVEIQFSSEVPKAKQRFLMNAVRSQFSVTEDDAFVAKTFKVFKEDKAKVQSDNVKKMIGQIGVPAALVLLALVVVVFALMVSKMTLRNSKMVQSGLKDLAKSIESSGMGGGGTAMPEMAIQQQQQQIDQNSGSQESVSELGDAHKAERIRSDFKNSVDKHPFVWTKYVYDLAFQPLGESYLSNLLSYASTEFYQGVMNIIPFDAKEKINKAVIEGTIGKIPLRIEDVIETMLTKVTSEAAMYNEEFPEKEMLDLAKQKNEHLAGYYEKVASQKKKADALLYLIRTFTPKRISDIMEIGSSNLKEKMTVLILDKSSYSGININKAVLDTHNFFFKWAKSNVKEHAPDINMGKYVGQILNNVSEETVSLILSNIDDNKLARELNMNFLSLRSLDEVSLDDLTLLLDKIHYNDIAIIHMFASEKLQSRIFEAMPEKKVQMVKDTQLRYDDAREKRKAKNSFPDKQANLINVLRDMLNKGEITLGELEEEEEEVAPKEEESGEERKAS